MRPEPTEKKEQVGPGLAQSAGPSTGQVHAVPLFQPAYDPRKNRSTPPEELAPGYWFLFHRNNLLLPVGSTSVPYIQQLSESTGDLSSPTSKTSPPLNAYSSPPYDSYSSPSSLHNLTWVLPYIPRIYYFGSLRGTPCWACAVSLDQNENSTPTPAQSEPAFTQTSPAHSSKPLSPAAGENSAKTLRNAFATRNDARFPGPGDLPEGWEAVNLRMAYGRLSPEELQAARFASHLLFWDRNTGYCGVCGAPTLDKPDERAKVCSDPTCRAVFYPKISPAVIVAILDGERILLAHNRRFTSKFYSLIAGFVEIGESLEECVRREVLEEVGVRVQNIRYFGSQPWPTPDSLMIGFVADYAGGEIRIQDNELYDARWFSPPDMPDLPPSDSIARKILRWYETEYVPSIRSKAHG